jgi:leader peptidase (prepilin peptidase)/N-methyltransferase
MKVVEWIMLLLLAGFAAYDLKTKTVPLAAVAAFAVGTLVYRICTGTGMAELAAGLVPGAVVLLLAFATRESIGIGDGLVLCVLGMFCGWRQCLAMFGMALVLSSVLAMVLLACRKVGRKTELPFLPSLFGGYLLFYLW